MSAIYHTDKFPIRTHKIESAMRLIEASAGEPSMGATLLQISQQVKAHRRCIGKTNSTVHAFH